METATANLQTGKADASRVSALEASVNTAGTGLLARTTAVETATANLQTGKADASRVTTLEATATSLTRSMPALTFAEDARFWGGNLGAADPYNVTFLTTTRGRAAQNATDFYGIVAPLAAMPAVQDTDRTYRIVAVHEAASGAPFLELRAAVNNAQYGEAGEPFYASAVFGPFAAGWHTTTANLIVPAGSGPWVRPVALLNRFTGAYLHRLLSLTIEDVTEATALSARATSLETATANLQTGKADATRVATLEARASASNLLPKSQFFPGGGLGGWTYGGDIPTPTVGLHPNEYFAPPPERPLSVYQPTSGGGYGDWYSPVMTVEPGKRYCASAFVGKVQHNSNAQWIFIEWWGPGIGYQYTSGATQSFHYNEKAGGVLLSDYKRIYQFGTAPAGAQSGRLTVRQANLGAVSTAFTYRPMFSEATDVQVEPPPWSPSASEARLSVQETASADLYGRTYARWALGAAVPGATAFIEARAETSPGAAPTSSVAIGARQFTVYNTAGSTWLKALDVQGGNVVLTGGLQAGAFIRLGNGTGWPVALKGVDFNATDGAAVSFGTDLGQLPSLTFAMNNLLPLAAGETYDVKVTGLTATGFTLSAKIAVPGTPTAYDRTASATTSAFGSGGIYISKTADPNSSDGTYRMQATGTNQHDIVGQSGGALAEDTYDYVTGEIQVWAKKSGTWNYITSVYVGSSVDRRSYSTSYQSVPGNWSMDETVQLGDSVQEVGLRPAAPSAQAVVSTFTHLIWTAPGSGSGTRTALATGASTRIRVQPQ